MLTENDIVMAFIGKYRALMDSLNEGIIPEGIHAQIESRDEIFDWLDEVETYCTKMVGENFIQSIKGAVVDTLKII